MGRRKHKARIPLQQPGVAKLQNELARVRVSGFIHAACGRCKTEARLFRSRAEANAHYNIPEKQSQADYAICQDTRTSRIHLVPRNGNVKTLS